MPIYEYVCSACQHRTDILHGIYEDGPAFCPSCGAEGTLRKAFVAPAVHFKGTGWAKKERSSGAMTKAAAAEAGGDRSERSEASDRGDRSDGSTGEGSTKSPGSDSGSKDRSEAGSAKTAKPDPGAKAGSSSSGGTD